MTFRDATVELGFDFHLETASYTYVDIENDGDLDIVSVPEFGPVLVYRINSSIRQLRILVSVTLTKCGKSKLNGQPVSAIYCRVPLRQVQSTPLLDRTWSRTRTTWYRFLAYTSQFGDVAH